MQISKGKHSKKYEEYFQKHKTAILEDFFTFLRFPSISADPFHKKDILACAEWVGNFLKQMGFQVEQWTTPVNPVVFGEYKAKKKESPTLLIYCHYDVQPVDPLELWKTPPFTPTLVEGEVVARGACDNKGQCFYTLSALRAFLEMANKEGLHIKVLIDGEEETGSRGLFHVLQERKERLQADYAVIVDSNIPSLQQPAVTLGCRGIVTFDVECVGSNVDLHSGQLGGIALNPLRALVEMLAQVWDKDGRIQIEGFYEGIRPFDEKQLIQVDTQELIDKFQLQGLYHEKGFSLLQSNWLRPTFEINGLSGGYAGPGFKTVIPAKASCKISCRLVDGQEAQHVAACVERFLKKTIAKGMELRVELHQGANAYVTSSKSLFARKIKQAYEDTLGIEAGFILSGGSLPICAKIAEVSGADTVCMGYGLDDDYIHAPNEHFGVDRLQYGLMTLGSLLELLNV
ncbi:MAG: M20 family dipeptidase [Chlamydiae bacterium]|nr:M20 family dipeptidase [Chlamydiota bacterium]